MKDAELLPILLLSIVAACAPPKAPETAAPKKEAHVTTYDDDVAYLKAHGEVIELEAPGGGRVAVSPKYQARVMTSAVARNAASLGWIHRAFIDKGQTGTAFDNYGGEDRFWLGPESGQFGLYFPRAAPFEFDKWQTPHALQEGAWEVAAKSPTSVTFAREMAITNYIGTEFRVRVEREVRIAEAGDLPPGLQVVAYESVNRVKNVGNAAWVPERGLLSVWILGMYSPAADAFVVVPFEKEAQGPVVNDAYFGKVPAERLAVRDDHVVLKCDGKYRSKIGLGPLRARGVAASFSASSRLLTIVTYDPPQGPTRYVNSMWEIQKEPYAGDVVNSYNDGPTGPGKPSLGGFYEIETSSPGAELAPGATLVHAHRTTHLTGDPDALDLVARTRVGVPLSGFRL